MMMLVLLMLLGGTVKQRRGLWRYGNQAAISYTPLWTPLFVYILWDSLEVRPWLLLLMTSHRL